MCIGFNRDGQRCGSPDRYNVNGTKFCKWHGPNGSNSKSTDPAEFRLLRCRSLLGADVLEMRDHMDAYRLCSIPTTDGLQLDHVVEIHILRDAFDETKRYKMLSTSEQAQLKDAVTTNVNMLENLNFTSEALNEMKFKGMYLFATDYRKSQVKPQGLFDYLPTCKPERKVSRRIQDEIVHSYESIVEGYQHENKLHMAYLDNLEPIFHAMKLK
eukprot:gene10278-8200_t